MVGEDVVTDDTNVRLDIYKLAVEMADRVSARRAGANTFFVTLNTALAAVVGIVSAARKLPPHGSVPSSDAFGLVLTAIAGIVFAGVWWLLLRYYRQLSAAKWDVITNIERALPESPFTHEWVRLHPEPESVTLASVAWWRLIARFQRWRRGTRHREATLVEQVVPFVFVVIYFALLLRVVVQ